MDVLLDSLLVSGRGQGEGDAHRSSTTAVVADGDAGRVLLAELAAVADAGGSERLDLVVGPRSMLVDCFDDGLLLRGRGLGVCGGGGGEALRLGAADVAAPRGAVLLTLVAEVDVALTEAAGVERGETGSGRGGGGTGGRSLLLEDLCHGGFCGRCRGGVCSGGSLEAAHAVACVGAGRDVVLLALLTFFVALFGASVRNRHRH